MSYEIKKVDVWSAEISDQPGSLANVIQPLAESGANLKFLLARRTTEGKGVVFVSPIEGQGVIKKAKSLNFKKNDGISAVQITGPDKPGLGAKILQSIALGGINIRGISASATGKNCTIWIAFDNTKDANKALKLIENALSKK
ncbi:MAG: amino acid-binding protein [Candidatus Hydrogenedentes bacterium]|nr:amino acid-binding protein [Candidatus Hydrogenedentota bacterium]